MRNSGPSQAHERCLSFGDQMAGSNKEREVEIARHFVDANLVGEPREVLSPSGRYRLVIRTYRTAPSRWDYSRGTVVRVRDGAVIADLQRNLSAFHHTFVTKDDREHLITGRSYMSQTIVDLDRGLVHEPPGDHYNGTAFCWARCYLSPDGNTLAVDGCIWSRPYEFRFFDFTDPARGWPELPISGADRLEDPSDRQESRWIDAKTFECFQCDCDAVPQERTRIERQDNAMRVVNQWVSGPEAARRAEEARAEADQEAWWAEFRSTNAMYLRLVELIRAHRIPGETLDWQPGGRRIVQHFRRQQPRASADLDWDIEAGTVKLQLYTPTGERDRELSFDHSRAGIEAAVDVVAHVFA